MKTKQKTLFVFSPGNFPLPAFDEPMAAQSTDDAFGILH